MCHHKTEKYIVLWYSIQKFKKNYLQTLAYMLCCKSSVKTNQPANKCYYHCSKRRICSEEKCMVYVISNKMAKLQLIKSTTKNTKIYTISLTSGVRRTKSLCSSLTFWPLTSEMQYACIFKWEKNDSNSVTLINKSTATAV